MGDAPQYTNTATVKGNPPKGPPVHASDTVIAKVTLTSGLRVLKLQRIGTAGPFTKKQLTAKVGSTIEYKIEVFNTGQTPLTLSITDKRCDPHTLHSPTQVKGTLTGNTLSPGGEADYRCTHKLTAGDPTILTNVATITGRPPTGPPVHGTSKVKTKKTAVKHIHVCRTSTGTIIHYHGNTKPRACHPSRKPNHPKGFTGAADK